MDKLETALCDNLTIEEKVELWNIVAGDSYYSERLITLDDLIDEACDDPKELTEIIVEFSRGVDAQSDYFYWDDVYGLMSCNVHDFFELHVDSVSFWWMEECWITPEGEFDCSNRVPVSALYGEVIQAFIETINEQ